MVASQLANYQLAIDFHFEKVTQSYFGLKPKLRPQNRIPTSILACIIHCMHVYTCIYIYIYIYIYKYICLLYMYAYIYLYIMYISIKTNVATDEENCGNEIWHVQTMKLEQLYQIGSECELKSLPDGSVERLNGIQQSRVQISLRPSNFLQLLQIIRQW